MLGTGTIKNSFKGIETLLKNLYRRTVGYGGVLYNVRGCSFRRRCLLIYITSPINAKHIHSHQNESQVVEIVQVLTELGYNVDVMHYREVAWRFPRSQYDIIIDIIQHSERFYSKRLKPRGIKILYGTGAESNFANQAELERITALEVRRNVRIRPRRQAPLLSDRVADYYDAFLLIGNKWTLESYREYGFSKEFLLHNTGYSGLLPDTLANRQPNKFIFIGSYGQVHKGLDLLLEIFRIHPDWHLYICSNVAKEDDFCEVYHSELYNLPNIHTLGFVDIYSDVFKKLAEECVFMILPSCSEGQAGSVVTAMSAGFIPIVSKQCGYDDKYVMQLPDCNIKTIEVVLQSAKETPSEHLEEMMKKTYEYSQTDFSLNSFSRAFKAAMIEILGCK